MNLQTKSTISLSKTKAIMSKKDRDGKLVNSRFTIRLVLHMFMSHDIKHYPGKGQMSHPYKTNICA